MKNCENVMKRRCLGKLEEKLKSHTPKKEKYENKIRKKKSRKLRNLKKSGVKKLKEFETFRDENLK